MRSLYLVALMAGGAMMAAAVPTQTNYCSTGTLTTAQSVFADHTVHHTTTGCTLSDALTFTTYPEADKNHVIKATSEPDVRFSFTNGVLQSTGRIIVSLYGDKSDWAEGIPIVVRVTGNTIGQGSKVVVSGRFPPRSVLTFSDNTGGAFAFDQPTFGAFSQVVIEGNLIKAGSVDEAGTYTFVDFTGASPAQWYHNASLSVSGNTLDIFPDNEMAINFMLYQTHHECVDGECRVYVNDNTINALRWVRRGPNVHYDTVVPLYAEMKHNKMDVGHLEEPFGGIFAAGSGTYHITDNELEATHFLGRVPNKYTFGGLDARHVKFLNFSANALRTTFTAGYNIGLLPFMHDGDEVHVNFNYVKTHRFRPHGQHAFVIHDDLRSGAGSLFQLKANEALAAKTATMSLSQSLTHSRSSSVTPSPTGTVTLSGTRTITPTITATLTVTQSQSLTASASVTTTASATTTATPTTTASSSLTATASVSLTGSRSGTVSPSASASASVTTTASRSVTASQSGTASSSLSATDSQSATASESGTASESISATDSASTTASESATASDSQSATGSESATSSQSGTASDSLTATDSASATASQSATSSSSASASDSPTATGSESATGSATLIPTPSLTVIATPSATTTPTATGSHSASASNSQTATTTGTASPTASQSGTASGSLSASDTVLVPATATNVIDCAARTQAECLETVFCRYTTVDSQCHKSCSTVTGQTDCTTNGCDWNSGKCENPCTGFTPGGNDGEPCVQDSECTTAEAATTCVWLSLCPTHHDQSSCEGDTANDCEWDSGKCTRQLTAARHMKVQEIEIFPTGFPFFTVKGVAAVEGEFDATENIVQWKPFAVTKPATVTPAPTVRRVINMCPGFYSPGLEVSFGAGHIAPNPAYETTLCTAAGPFIIRYQPGGFVTPGSQYSNYRAVFADMNTTSTIQIVSQFDTALAATAAPMHVSITNVAFKGPSAGIVLGGAFPPNSVITIANNVFTLGGNAADHVAITLGVSAAVLSLGATATLRIEENSLFIEGSNANAQVAFVAAPAFAAVGADTKMAISSNTVRTVGDNAHPVSGIWFPAQTTCTASCEVLIRSNIISATTPARFGIVFGLTGAAEGSYMDIDVAGNRIEAADFTSAMAISADSPALVLTVTGNAIRNLGTTGDATIQLESAAGAVVHTLRVSGNSLFAPATCRIIITGMARTAAIRGFKEMSAPTGPQSITVSSNHLEAGRQGSTSFFFIAPLAYAAGTTFTMSNNVAISAVGSGTLVEFRDVVAEGTFVSAGNTVNARAVDITTPNDDGEGPVVTRRPTQHPFLGGAGAVPTTAAIAALIAVVIPLLL